MRFAALIVSLLVFSGLCTRAQSAPNSDALLPAPQPQLVAQNLNGSRFSPMLSASLFASPAAALPVPAPAPQGVQGVFPNPSWQVYGGYSYARFYEVPNTVVNLNGFTMSMAYYFKDWIAGEGELSAGLGSEGGQRASLVSGGGGVRLRWAKPRAVELWVHGVIGGAHYAPKTSFGGQGALAYEVGGGFDLRAHHQHFAYRFEGDMLGTTFFGTYQLSPKISAGIVYKF